MKLLLDSNAVIALFKGHPAFISRLRRNAVDDVKLSAIVAHELYYGAFKSQRQVDNLSKIEALMFEILAFDQDDAREAGDIRAQLAHTATPIGPYDVLIAGQAPARGMTFITRNIREFSRVSGLISEDWESEA